MDHPQTQKVGLGLQALACAFGGAAAIIPLVGQYGAPPDKYGNDNSLMWMFAAVGVIGIATTIWSMFSTTKVLWTRTQKRFRLLFTGTIFLGCAALNVWILQRVFRRTPLARFDYGSISQTCIFLCIALQVIGSMLRTPAIEDKQIREQAVQ